MFGAAVSTFFLGETFEIKCDPKIHGFTGGVAMAYRVAWEYPIDPGDSHPAEDRASGRLGHPIGLLHG